MAGVSLQARLVGTGDVRLPRLDYVLLGCTLALALLGLVMVTRSISRCARLCSSGSACWPG
jgi:hypothetical protein